MVFIFFYVLFTPRRGKSSLWGKHDKNVQLCCTISQIVYLIVRNKKVNCYIFLGSIGEKL